MKNALTAALISVLMGSFGQSCLAAESPLKLGEERIPPGEDQAITGIVELQTKIMKATNPHVRGQHPKAHGCVETTFTVLPDISSDLKVGIFQVSKSYKALIRFSNGRSVSDPEADVHGMAIKISGVEGKEALPRDTSDAQDFILIDNETFFARDAETLLGFMMAKAAAQKDPNAIKAFAAKSPNNQRTDWQGAISDAIDHAKTLAMVDPTRVGLLGFSLGGHLCLRVRAKARVLVEFFAPVLDGIGPGGTLAHAQIHHGKDDSLPGTGFPNAVTIADTLKGEGTSTELFPYPGAGHGFIGGDPDNTRARDLSKERTLSFFESHL